MKTLANGLLIAIFSGFAATSVSAEKITFNGYIAEYSCSADSLDKDCKDLSGLVNTLKKTENSLSLNQLVRKSNQKAANLSVQDLENKQNKVLIVNYN
jgi:type 1 fimbria pilin